MRHSAPPNQRVRVLQILMPVLATLLLGVMLIIQWHDVGVVSAEAELTPAQTDSPSSTPSATAEMGFETPSLTATAMATTVATTTATAVATTTATAVATTVATTVATATATAEGSPRAIWYLPFVGKPVPPVVPTATPSPTPSPTPLPPPLAPPTPVTQNPPIDFDAARTVAREQGLDIATNKIGFHVGVGGKREGLKESLAALDAAGVAIFLKSANDAEPLYWVQQMMETSGIDHVLVYRDVAQDLKEPEYSLPPEDAASLLWRRNVAAFPPELDPSKVWMETVNEPDKNRSAWLAEFSLASAEMAVSEGRKYAAFGWASGEPEPYDWESPEMLAFLRYAGEHPDQVAVSIHEYSYRKEEISYIYPWLVGRFQKLFRVCDENGIARPTVLITEWGWEYTKIPQTDKGDVDVEAAMEDIAWASWLYAAYPQVKGAAIWYLGPGFSNIDEQTQELIVPLQAYSLSHYFVIDPGFGRIDESIFELETPTDSAEFLINYYGIEGLGRRSHRN